MSAPALQIRLFGGLELVERGRSLKFSAPAKAASLLAFLIVHRSQPVTRDAVAFAFWPDEDEVRSRANLRRHVALLQHALPARAAQPAVLTGNRSLRWNPSFDCTVDIVEFERLSADEDGALEATALYRGDLLPSAYDEWIHPERERLRTMQGANLERLTERYARSGDYAKAISTTRALLAHDPWREDALRTLLSLRQAAGDRAGALQEYESFAGRLQRDLGVAPMPETVSRYESILRNDGRAEPERSASAFERSTVSAVMPFVGRSGELLRLRQMWLRAMRGFGGVAIVSGEAGIGKSRLVAEFGAVAASQGGQIVAGAASFPESRPYQAVVEALRTALPAVIALPLDRMWLAAAADVVPDLRDADAGLLRLSALAPERQQDRLFEAIWRCFEGLARARPLVLVLEDIHWAGPATVDLLAYLARRARSHSMLVVVTYRDDETDAAHSLRVLRHTLRLGGSFANVPLGGIAAEHVEIVLAAALAGHSTSAFAQRAHELCCGNPFFLAEIVRDCLAAPDRAEPVLPHSLKTSIEARLAKLSPDAASQAQIASVVGRAFTVEIIAAAAGTSEGSTIRSMDELLDMRLIREAGGEAAGGGDFVFTHDLIRSHLYGRIPPALRKRQHRRIGFVLERLHAGALDALVADLARHFDEGDEPGVAAKYFFASARAALRLYANAEALRASSRAAELTADPALRYDAVAMRETIHGRAGRRAEQLADLETLESLAEAVDDESRRFECVRRRLTFARAIDDIPGQERWLAVLRSRLADGGRSYGHAFWSECRAALMTALGRYDDGLRSAGDALGIYRELDDAAGAVRSLCLLADIRTLRAEPAESQAALDEGTAIAVSSSNEASIVRALAAAALAAYLSVDYERARSSAERGLELCRAIGDREGEADFLFRLGNIAGRRFAVAEATGSYAAATTIYEALNKPLGRAIVLLNTGLLFLKIGEHAQTLAALRRARAIFVAVNDLRGLTVCAINLGMTAYFRGRFGAAARLSRKALALARQLGNPQLECSALGNVGAAERELGEIDAALAHSEAALAQRRRMAPMDIGSDLADMGLTYLRAGDLRAATAIAAEIEALPVLALETVMFPQDVLWSAARIYAAASMTDAYGRTVRNAVRLYEERLEKIPDGPWRLAYGRLAFNRHICEAGRQQSDADRTAAGVPSEA